MLDSARLRGDYFSSPRDAKRRGILKSIHLSTAKSTIQIDEFGEGCLGSSHGATRPVTVQKVMVFCVFDDGYVSGREKFAMAEKDQKPVIYAKEEVLDGSQTIIKLKAFWRQRCGVLSGKKPELQAVGEDFDILGRTSVTMPRVGFFTSFHPFYAVLCSARITQMPQGQSHRQVRLLAVKLPPSTLLRRRSDTWFVDRSVIVSCCG